MRFYPVHIHRSTTAFLLASAAAVYCAQSNSLSCLARPAVQRYQQLRASPARLAMCSAASPSRQSRVVREAPFGEWESSITSSALTAATVALSDLSITSEQVYWLEGRPQHGGRIALLAAPLADVSSVREIVSSASSDGSNGNAFSVRTRVHEYGGGAYVIDETSRRCFFSNFADQRVYSVGIDSGTEATPTPITEPNSSQRFADYFFDSNSRKLFCVRETHFPDKDAENDIVTIDPEAGHVDVVVSGHDFYASPRLNSDGSRLVFQAWDHPSMPWDSTGIYTADIKVENGTVLAFSVTCIAGGKPYGHPDSVSVMQPTFDPSGDLYYISDQTDWWGIYKHTDSAGPKAVFVQNGVEVGGPQWMFAAQSYHFFSASSCLKMLVAYSDIAETGTQLAVVDLNSGKHQTLSKPISAIRSLRVSPNVSKDGMLTVALIGGSSTTVSRVSLLSLDTYQMRCASESVDIKLSSSLSVKEEYLSEPQVVEFPTTDNNTAFMLYYPPKNAFFECTDKSIRPPLLVKSHGGPTSAASTMYNPLIQYFTSRGFAVADINYGGSTGYGREYRNRLKGRWGIVDVEDCANAALHLTQIGLVDRRRLAISGGSAGGFTTLACLAFRTDVFGAGASYYGVADLNLLVAETHKFESRYMDSLVGPLPEAQRVYDERSPINSADKIRCPLVLFQGLEDKIVPPSQARKMYQALKGNGIRTALVEFPDEQHGFRGATAIRRSIDGEMWFYGQVFGFQPKLGADDFVPFDIE